MRTYDPSQPLIVIHVPKAAGTTSQQIFKEWFGEGFLSHYFNEKTGQMPDKYELFKMNSVSKPVLLHGHFNKLRSFGIENYYPEVQQFITILRDPFELAVSNYFYMRKVSSTWKDQTRVPAKGLENYLLNTAPGMLNHFPREVTLSNYKEMIAQYFIEIGVVERLNESMQRIAQKLNKHYDQTMLGRQNVTERDEDVPSYLKEMFADKYPLEFAVYRYALAKFN